VAATFSRRQCAQLFSAPTDSDELDAEIRRQLTRMLAAGPADPGHHGSGTRGTKVGVAMGFAAALALLAWRIRATPSETPHPEPDRSWQRPRPRIRRPAPMSRPATPELDDPFVAEHAGEPFWFWLVLGAVLALVVFAAFGIAALQAPR
jgi:hypothetical protein